MTIEIKSETWFCEKYGVLGHVLIPEYIIQCRIISLSVEISKKYKDISNLIVVIVLEGANIFANDLLRILSILDIHPKIFSIAVKSYNKTKRKSKTKWINITPMKLDDVENSDVLVIEDICDTGKTINFIHKLFTGSSFKPNSVTYCCLLDKDIKNRKLLDGVNIEFIGFKIPNLFVIGYGLDYDNKYRNIPFISVYKPTTITGYCDNTNCKIKYKQKLFYTTLTSDFNHDTCWWCTSCIERDKNMIESTKYLIWEK